MKIKSIYIDGLHNAVNKTYNFGDINYIYGNNGIGKSTILQAIQLALLGYIPGTAKNSREALLRHSPKGKIEVTISLTDTENDSDIIVNRRITAKTTEVNTIPGNIYISDIIQNIELPIFNFNEFMGQTANKLKEYFIKNILPTTDGNLDWKTILSEAIDNCNFADKDDIIEYGIDLVSELEGSALDQVIAANAKFKDEQSFNKSEAQKLQNTVNSLIYYDDYSGPKDINSINEMLLITNALRDSVLKYDSATQAIKAFDDEAITLKQRFKDLGGKTVYDEKRAEIQTLNSRLAELTGLISSAEKEVLSLQAEDRSQRTIIDGGGVCPYTKNSCSDILTKITSLKTDNEIIKTRISEVSDKLIEYKKEQTSAQTKVKEAESLVYNLKNIYDRIITLTNMQRDIPPKPDTDMDIFAIDNKIAELTKYKEELQANIKYNETIENLTKLKYENELKSEALSKWVKATDTNGLQTTLMETPFKDLADTLTNLIRAMYGNNLIKAHFNITNKANSFNFGLIRDDVYIPYDLLSSGEKCLYTLALMICITNADKSPLKLLLCDDMFDHLDSKTIENTFDTLKAYNKIYGKDIQFIFAGVKECRNAADIVLTV